MIYCIYDTSDITGGVHTRTANKSHVLLAGRDGKGKRKTPKKNRRRLFDYFIIQSTSHKQPNKPTTTTTATSNRQILVGMAGHDNFLLFRH